MSGTDVSTNSSTEGVPTYLGGGDPAGRFTDYYPAWLDNLADDVTIEGSLLDGAAEGVEAVRMIVGTIRELYEQQEFNFAGPWGENSSKNGMTKRPRETRKSVHHSPVAREPRRRL